MRNIYLFLADGFEDMEALGTVDILRRAELPVKTVSIMGQPEVTSAHGVTIKADLLFDAQALGEAEMLVLPGGLPGATNLNNHEGLRSMLSAHAERGGLLAAICAAPMVLGSLGLLKGKKATCYPGFEQYMEGAEATGALVQQDGNCITGKGPGATLEFAMTIVAQFCGKAKAEELKQAMMIPA